MPGESRATHWRLTAMVVLLGVAALRPAVPGDEVNASAANLNVYFVVDTTSSIIAEDYGNERPRISGVESDITAVTEALPGARYSVITFDQATRVRVPLTTDSNALDAALETLLPEPSEYSRGSSITAANERLGRMLEQAERAQPRPGPRRLLPRRRRADGPRAGRPVHHRPSPHQRRRRARLRHERGRPDEGDPVALRCDDRLHHRPGDRRGRPVGHRRGRPAGHRRAARPALRPPRVG